MEISKYVLNKISKSDLLMSTSKEWSIKCVTIDNSAWMLAQLKLSW
jgi:hypothetical protein